MGTLGFEPKWMLGADHDNQIDSSFIYVIYCAETGLHKIGFSDTPSERIEKLQSESAFPLEMVAQFQCKAVVVKIFEYTLHQIFKSKRAHGEWFKLNDEDIKSFDVEHLMAFTLTKCKMGKK